MCRNFRTSNEKKNESQMPDSKNVIRQQIR